MFYVLLQSLFFVSKKHRTMDIVIDCGNTNTKIAFYKEGNKTEMVFLSKEESIKKFLQNNKTEKYENGILSSVREREEETENYLKAELDFFLKLTHNTPIPVKNCYETPQTLGIDRIAAAVGANNLFPDTSLLVIDAGTAITIDFVSEKGEYKGGNILPGIDMRFRALNEFTDRLPLLSKSETKNKNIIGQNTKEAIIKGVQEGLIFEIEGYIEYFRQKKQDLKVLITGGDTFFFDKKLKNTIFAVDDLVINGLYIILEYNKDR